MAAGQQLCRHRQDAENVTHSALLKAARHVDGFRWEASLRTWLHRIATIECRMLRRRKVPASLDQLLEDAATAPGEPLQMPAAVLLKDGLGLSSELTHSGFGLMVPMLAAAATATLVAFHVDGYSIYSARLPAYTADGAPAAA